MSPCYVDSYFSVNNEGENSVIIDVCVDHFKPTSDLEDSVSKAKAAFKVKDLRREEVCIVLKYILHDFKTLHS